MMQTIHNITLYVLIFACGMLCGYLLKVVICNYERIKESKIIGCTRGVHHSDAFSICRSTFFG